MTVTDKHAKARAAGVKLLCVYLLVIENSQLQLLISADERMNYIMKNQFKMQEEMVHGRPDTELE